MRSPSSLSDLLAGQQRESPDSVRLYDCLIARLRALGVGATAPQVGEPFPLFTLPDALGHYESLGNLLSARPLVLSFVRGSWCPYCVHELNAWSQSLPALHRAGGHLSVITPEIGGRAALVASLLGAQTSVFSDVDQGVALNTGLAFFIGNDVLTAYHDAGLDLREIYGSNSGFLPVPATFVIDRAGFTRYAFVDPDFRVRAEPADVIDCVASLA